MNIILLGASGFIGTNLIIELSKDDNKLILVDKNEQYFSHIKKMNLKNIIYKIDNLDINSNYDELLKDCDVVYHLVSTTIPTTANQKIPEELTANVIMTAKMLESCVKNDVKKVIFISSGGTVYGKEGKCPLDENTLTNPISSYGVQKITIEKLLLLYNYMYKLDYRIIRLANPYGPYQRPNGLLGAVTTFVYKALKNDEITVYGDGTVIRDYIYIDDAVKAIINIANGNAEEKLYNVGSGYGISIKDLLYEIEKNLKCKLNIVYKEARSVDVKVNFLDISRYEKNYGKLSNVDLQEGITKTASFLRDNYLNIEG